MRRVAWLLALFIFMTPLTVHAKEPELRMMRATAYPDTGNKTKSGTWPHHGTAGAAKELIGLTAVVYQRLPGNQIGELIGIYEIEDTGTTEGCINGHVIDIWCPDRPACQEFMNRVYEDGCGGKVFVLLVEADG